MKKKFVVFLNAYPLGSVFAESLGMDLFRQAGYHLVYLDMSKIFYPETYDKFGTNNNAYVVKRKFFVECQTKEDVLKQIRKYSRTAWFYPLYIMFNQEVDKLWLMRALKKYQCDYILQGFFPIPLDRSLLITETNIIHYFITTFCRLSRRFKIKDILAKSVRWFCFFLVARDIYYRKPSHCFVAGNIMYNKFKKLYPKSNIVSVPSYDYFRYRSAVSNEKCEKSDEVPADEYVVYLDQSVFSGW